MFKTRIAVCLLAFLLLLLMVMSVPSVGAYIGRCYGDRPASNIYASRWNQTSDELMRSQWACQDIYNLFDDKGHWEICGYYWDEDQQMWLPTYGFVLNYGHVYNYYGDGTTISNVQYEAAHGESSHDFATVFHFGHGPGKIEGGTLHYGVYPDAPPSQQPHPEAIWDYDIHPFSGDKHRFEFLWSCGSANKLGGLDSNNHAAGLPFAWTHRGDGSLSTDGYFNPWSSGGSYCFIGFENYSMPLSKWINGQNNYKYWLVFFYYFALGGYSVHSALDQAWHAVNQSQNYFYQGELYRGYDYWFDGTNWLSKVHIYGNGGLLLP